MNLSPIWVSFLVDSGVEAIHWSSVGNPRATDQELMNWARNDTRVVFTHDLDFGTLLALNGASGPSVLQVRTLNLLPSAIGTNVVGVLNDHAIEFTRGALVTFDGATTRVRILPIRTSR